MAFSRTRHQLETHTSIGSADKYRPIGMQKIAVSLVSASSSGDSSLELAKTIGRM
jgi:hypothetical protein